MPHSKHFPPYHFLSSNTNNFVPICEEHTGMSYDITNGYNTGWSNTLTEGKQLEAMKHSYCQEVNNRIISYKHHTLLVFISLSMPHKLLGTCTLSVHTTLNTSSIINIQHKALSTGALKTTIDVDAQLRTVICTSSTLINVCNEGSIVLYNIQLHIREHHTGYNISVYIVLPYKSMNSTI